MVTASEVQQSASSATFYQDQRCTAWPDFDKSVSELHALLDLTQRKVKSQIVTIGDVAEIESSLMAQKVTLSVVLFVICYNETS